MLQGSKTTLVKGKRITPDMLDVHSFLEDYERMYQETCDLGQGAFRTAEPFPVIPWMEAIVGCEVYATDASFVTHPSVRSMDYIKKVDMTIDDVWMGKYLEFVKKLQDFSQDWFPIGQPITRGLSDILGAMLGQEQMVYALYDEPEKMKELFFQAADVFTHVIGKQYEVLTDFHGGYSMGFYHLWCPGRCIWFQEDLSSLLSQDLYREFIKKPDEAICAGYEYTMVHLHCSSFSILDDLMEIPSLKVIEVNKDTGGPSVEEMLPVFKKIQGKKNLVIWGDLNEEDIACIKENLSCKGLFLNILEPAFEEALKKKEYIDSIYT